MCVFKMWKFTRCDIVRLWIIVNCTLALEEETLCFTSGLHRTGRIVGGADSNPAESPYMVSLTRRGGHYCGGVIISDRWILTAGHCVCNGLGRFMSPSQIKAVLGQHRISDFKNNANYATAYQVDIVRIVPHFEYSCSSPANDIAMLELNKRIQFNAFVQSVCISTEAVRDDEGHLSRAQRFATVSGWGWTQEDQAIGDRADVLQKAVVTVFSSQQCRQIYENNEHGVQITDRQICAGHLDGGTDSCWADSGGPLIGSGNRLIGIVSTGIGCARPGLPGIYTQVADYVGWIRRNTVA